VKVLVALIGETRAWELTAESFFSNLLDPLGADLAICGRSGESPNPLYERAKYIWSHDELGDWAKEYDRAVGSTDWRCLLPTDPKLLGGIEDPEHPQTASGAILWFYRALLARSIDEDGLLDRYDWIIVSRSDLMWPLPHPPVARLSRRHIYFLDGEQYGGVTDRHAILPSRYAAPYLHLADTVFADPVDLKRRIDCFVVETGWSQMNPERFIAFRLWEMGLFDRVRYVPYVAYAVRSAETPTRWSEGVYDETLGYYVKYPDEKQRSEIAARFISDEDSWRRYLARIRGLPRRRALLEAYRERGLFERRFAEEPDLMPLPRRVREELRLLPARVGRQLRRLPGLTPVLDARVERLQRRAERRQLVSGDRDA
jgi:hypothetical protein